MSLTHHALAILGILALILGGTACKTRDPNAAGVLDSRPMDPSGADPQNDVWNVVCLPASGAAMEDPSNVRYLITVLGGVSPTDESQPILVSVQKMLRDKGQTIPISTNESGRGAVSPYGSIFIGFGGGVLTATYGTASMGFASHGGIMTLSNDSDAVALSVDCQVEAPGKRHAAQ